MNNLAKNVKGFRELSAEEVAAVSGGEIVIVGDHTDPWITTIRPEDLLAVGEWFGSTPTFGELGPEMQSLEYDPENDEAQEILVVGDKLSDPGMADFRNWFLGVTAGNPDLDLNSFLYFNFGHSVLVLDPITGLGTLFERSLTSSDVGNNYEFEFNVHSVTIGQTESVSNTLQGSLPAGATIGFTTLGGTTVSFTIGPRD